MNRTLYVANLSPTMSQRELQVLFSQVGEVTTVVVMRDEISGRERSVAYVEMQSPDDAQAAVARFDQYAYRGRTLAVSNHDADAGDSHDQQHDRGLPSAAPSQQRTSRSGHPATESTEMLDEGGPLRAGD